METVDHSVAGVNASAVPPPGAAFAPQAQNAGGDKQGLNAALRQSGATAWQLHMIVEIEPRSR
jgi:hypothetical protein